MHVGVHLCSDEVRLMSEIETITVDLPRSMVDNVRKSVESGQFLSHSQAVQVALREWQARHLAEDYSLDELRRLVDEGIASGPSTIGSMTALKDEARRRWRHSS